MQYHNSFDFWMHTPYSILLIKHTCLFFYYNVTFWIFRNTWKGTGHAVLSFSYARLWNFALYIGKPCHNYTPKMKLPRKHNSSVLQIMNKHTEVCEIKIEIQWGQPLVILVYQSQCFGRYVCSSKYTFTMPIKLIHVAIF